LSIAAFRCLFAVFWLMVVLGSLIPIRRAALCSRLHRAPRAALSTLRPDFQRREAPGLSGSGPPGE
jgi:hypothetical protein